ncbi:MAG: substrate-binding domain-containing protein [Candidatus Sumerlaeia bacterium]|nr:substrate-binding domain-containing protein [Candidatus Sumerlaeia bacterium]
MKQTASRRDVVAAMLAGLGAWISPARAAEEKKLTIAVIPKGTTHEFWKSIHAGAVKAARELNVEVIWKGPLKEDDREQQIKVVENFVTRGVDGIVLAPLDDRALVPCVHDAIARKIPVVIIDSDLRSDRYVSFVATDNYKGGVLGARRLAELLGGKGKVILLRYAEGSASTMAREAGFLDTIKKEFPGIEVVSSNQYGGATAESSYKKAENLLLRFKDVDGIFCPNESTTFGMLRALQNTGRAGKVKFVGFDSSEKLAKALKDGELHGLVLQHPFYMGYMGVKTMVQHLRGEKVEKRIDTGCEVITKENMDTPEKKELILPDLSKWLE